MVKNILTLTPKDYRDETADYVIAAGRPVREVARELGMAGSTLGDWVRRRRELSGGGPAAAPPSSPACAS